MSYEEILDDFKSLENLAATMENVDLTENDNNNTVEGDQKYKKYSYLQLQDYRRPKFHESLVENINRKFNRSYTLQEMKDEGLEVTPMSRRTSQQKFSDNALLLSEFIL